jgi:hypothetical protein
MLALFTSQTKVLAGRFFTKETEPILAVAIVPRQS